MAKEYVTKMTLLSEGSLIKIYGSKTFLNVAPAFNIDRVRFSIVDIGAKGQNPMDIYLNTEEVRKFVADIDSGEAKRRIDADKGNYPTAYQWVKGTNGSKKLIIGGGQKGIRVQAQDTTAKINKFAVIQYGDLLELAFTFKLISGLIPVTPRSYYDRLLQAFLENEGKYMPQYNETEDADYRPTAEEDTQEAVPVSEAVPFQDMQTAIAPQHEEFTTVNSGTVMKTNGFRGIPVAIAETGESAILVFSEQVIPTLKWFSAYEARVNKSERVTLKVKAKRKQNNLMFISVA